MRRCCSAGCVVRVLSHSNVFSTVQIRKNFFSKKVIFILNCYKMRAMTDSRPTRALPGGAQ